MGVRDDHEAWSREGDPMDAMHKANRTRIEKLPAPPTWRPLLGTVKPGDRDLEKAADFYDVAAPDGVPIRQWVGDLRPDQARKVEALAHWFGQVREEGRQETKLTPVVKPDEAAPRVRRSRGITP